ncbi:MAG TPA: amidohydrolase family protein, partial [Thermoanaerobaculia bacterium]
KAIVAEIARGGLAELHTHLGASVDPAVMWTLAHEQGIALPVKDYWEFVDLVTVDARGVEGLPALDEIYKWTELIQSSPLAVERSVHGAIGGAYRTQNITTLELRFNPMKRNRGGERDLDHIIMAAVRGLDLASLEYPRVRAGLILMMDRTFTREQNEVIVEKAIRYRGRGIVGLDIAGPRPDGGRYPYRELAPLVEEARAAGLGITIHVGEEGGADGIAEIGEVVEHLRPDRIGHGILAAQDEETMRLLVDAGVVLEICPTSNLLTKALPDEEALRDTVAAFVDRGIAFTIATDGPEMMRTHLRDELQLLLELGVIDVEALQTVNARGHETAFIHRTV